MTLINLFEGIWTKINLNQDIYYCKYLKVKLVFIWQSFSCVLDNFLHEWGNFDLGCACATLINTLWSSKLSVGFILTELTIWNSIFVITYSAWSINSWDSSAVTFLQSFNELSFGNWFNLIVWWLWVRIIGWVWYNSCITCEWVLDIIK